MEMGFPAWQLSPRPIWGSVRCTKGPPRSRDAIHFDREKFKEHTNVEFGARFDGPGAGSGRIRPDIEKPLKPLKMLFSLGTHLDRF